MRFLLIIFFSFILLIPAQAQLVRDLSGNVYSGDSKEVLPGASITIFYSGKVAGLIANKEGHFVIAAGTPLDSLRISMVGHYSKVFSGNQLNGFSFGKSIK